MKNSSLIYAITYIHRIHMQSLNLGCQSPSTRLKRTMIFKIWFQRFPCLQSCTDHMKQKKAMAFWYLCCNLNKFSCLIELIMDHTKGE
uniref:Sister chromatid cohesion protein PDS5 homolog A n=1 Tax=Rhizophora mucronata TaxID=61149 RepID=A0A2P2IXR3_RHIMU